MDASTVVNLVTPVVVPLIIAGVKSLRPKIPSWLLPIIAPILGTLMGYIASVALHNTGNLWLSAVLGLAGVGVREVVDQLRPVSDPVEPK